ncbi:thiamine pyrophosphokinase (TPK) (Thiamine diphospho kinase) [[Clostridium] sordellii]|uniref:thiamine diphosphokinase n=1 Tax=Paraclostridium sordellii TaxID=1505 RepID=UPI0005DDA0B5|nr:thiamine diphosphokinase [Paeniclostridium sordellii]CEN76660.1 thiamine pyrophosphokinase (TPK) (Thiamine diphospho kinase) [[Clostridium] sordellii] [Paeniclostridium sordellii]
MRACIILNGEIKSKDFLQYTISSNGYEYIICADGGAKHLYELDIIPHYILGDLDSLEEHIIEFYKRKKVEFKKFPSRKNETDTQLCVHLANELGVEELHLLGALGGRVDHTLANINLMYYIKELGIKPIIKSENEDIYIIENENITICGQKGNTVSIIPLKGDLKGITLKNLEYPLNDANIKFGDPIGLSNVMTEDSFNVNLDKGSILIILNKKAV